MPKPGDWVGAYRIVRQIGKGGMGAVFEAVTEKDGATEGAPTQRAAIKVLHARFSGDPEALARFLNEGRAIAAVDHPGIVRFLETGQLPSGACYIAMEFLDGETLGARLKRERRLGRSVLRIGSEVANALAAAHRRSIIHRDLKPSNIILVPPSAPGEPEKVKLIDFGIAKLSAEDKEVQDFNTRTGTMLGTPVYMAPEQCRGVEVTDRTDVYSLGVMLYQSLAGRPPFASQADGDVLAMHILVPAPPLRQFEPAVPENVARFIESMLAKNGAERPSMEEVEGRLRELADDPSWSQPQQPVPEQPSAVTPVRPVFESVELVTTVTPPPRGPHESASATLGGATGQSGSGPQPPRSRRGLILGGAAALCLLSLAGAIVLRSIQVPRVDQRNKPPEVATPQPPPVSPPPGDKPKATPMVHWIINTQPAGATVLAEDGKPLGHTPWTQDEPEDVGEKTVLLRLQGYKDLQVSLSRSRNVEQNLLLVSDAPPPPPPGKKGRKKGRKGSANETIIDFKTNRPLTGAPAPAQRPAR